MDSTTFIIVFWCKQIYYSLIFFTFVNHYKYTVIMENLFILEDPGCDLSMLEKMSEEGDIKAKVELARCYRDRLHEVYSRVLYGTW